MDASLEPAGMTGSFGWERSETKRRSTPSNWEKSYKLKSKILLSRFHLLDLSVSDFCADSTEQRGSTLFVAGAFLLLRSRRDFLGHFALSRFTLATADLN